MHTLNEKEKGVNVENSKLKTIFAVDKNANEQIFEIVSVGDSLFTGYKWSNKWKNQTAKKTTTTSHAYIVCPKINIKDKKTPIHVWIAYIDPNKIKCYIYIVQRGEKKGDYKLLLQKTCSEDNEMRTRL